MSRRGLREVFLSVLLPALLVAVLFVPPAVAQGPEGDPIYTTREGPGHELYRDGTLVIGGDVVGSCDAVVREARPKPVKPSRDLLRQVEICEEAGFSVPGSDSLPETGGPPVLSVLAALLAGGALYTLAVRR